jgi:hypothetical protein
MRDAALVALGAFAFVAGSGGASASTPTRTVDAGTLLAGPVLAARGPIWATRRMGAGAVVVYHDGRERRVLWRSPEIAVPAELSRPGWNERVIHHVVSLAASRSDFAFVHVVELDQRLCTERGSCRHVFKTPLRRDVWYGRVGRVAADPDSGRLAIATSAVRCGDGLRGSRLEVTGAGGRRLLELSSQTHTFEQVSLAWPFIAVELDEAGSGGLRLGSGEIWVVDARTGEVRRRVTAKMLGETRLSTFTFDVGRDGGVAIAYEPASGTRDRCGNMVRNAFVPLTGSARHLRLASSDFRIRREADTIITPRTRCATPPATLIGRSLRGRVVFTVAAPGAVAGHFALRGRLFVYAVSQMRGGRVRTSIYVRRVGKPGAS